MSEEYKLTYFNYRGIAEPIRFIFKLAEVPFEDIQLEWDQQWSETLKPKYPWGRLPVLQNGEEVISQSVTICRYLARKFKLTGSTELHAARCDELVDAMMELRNESVKIFIEQDYEKKALLRENFLKELVPPYLTRYSDILEKNGEWLVGSSVTWADLFIAYSFEFLESSLGQSVLVGFPRLEEHKTRVYGIPQIKAWIEARPDSLY